ncbi:MAG TPA: VapC toxin family PIN domain ribonuclease [Chloroflexota bacterium]|nr:VapC toxin family PIN domain ribonuclease [Chloroflexota bacterium]
MDAGALYAQADAEEPRHDAVARVLVAEREALVTTELAVAEADYLILTRLGVGVELAFLDDLAMGTYIVECLTRDELRIAREVVERYRELRLGLADASLVVLAHRYGTRRILTFDERAFRSVAPLQGGTFTVLPTDVT